jgi:hypothetical protein
MPPTGSTEQNPGKFVHSRTVKLEFQMWISVTVKIPHEIISVNVKIING